MSIGSTLREVNLYRKSGLNREDHERNRRNVYIVGKNCKYNFVSQGNVNVGQVNN